MSIQGSYKLYFCCYWVVPWTYGQEVKYSQYISDFHWVNICTYIQEATLLKNYITGKKYRYIYCFDTSCVSGQNINIRVCGIGRKKYSSVKHGDNVWSSTHYPKLFTGVLQSVSAVIFQGYSKMVPLDNVQFQGNNWETPLYTSHPHTL